MFTQQQKPETTRKRINVYSFDFDGCLFNSNYVSSNTTNRFIIHNEILITQITEELKKEKFDDVIFFIGSNRQSYEIDKINSTTFGYSAKGSCFYRLQELCNEINKRGNLHCRIDPYLLADTYGNRKPGESFDLIIKSLPKPTDETSTAYWESVKKHDENPPNHATWIFDHSKFTVLYAQLHKTALENPDADIIYNFYDDRPDILSRLKAAFHKHPDLFPKNITLNLHNYIGKNSTKFFSIQGTGMTDASYGDHIKEIASKCCHNENMKEMHALPDLDLDQFKKSREKLATSINLASTSTSQLNGDLKQSDLTINASSKSQPLSEKPSTTDADAKHSVNNIMKEDVTTNTQTLFKKTTTAEIEAKPAADEPINQGAPSHSQALFGKPNTVVTQTGPATNKTFQEDTISIHHAR